MVTTKEMATTTRVSIDPDFFDFSPIYFCHILGLKKVTQSNNTNFSQKTKTKKNTFSIFLENQLTIEILNENESYF